jgi:flagella basal body P-ring formation protein FlgA
MPDLNRQQRKLRQTTNTMNSRITRKATLFFLLLVINALTAQGGEVCLKPECVVNGSVVRLSEIASFANEHDAAQFGNIALFPAPKAGMERIVAAQEVRETLSLLGYETTPLTIIGSSSVIGATVTVESALVIPVANILTTSATTDLKAAEYVETRTAVDHSVALVSAYLQNKDRTDATWTVTPQFTQAHAKQVADMQQPEISGGKSPYVGRQYFTIRDAAHPLAKAVFLKVDVERIDRAVVARRRLEPGEIVTRDDIELREVSANINSQQAFREEAATVGLEVTRVIPEGQVLQSVQLRRPQMVKKGEIVTVYSVASGLYVKSSARALADGALGDVIMLQSLEGTSKIQARVTGAQEAMIFADSPRVGTRQPTTAAVQPAFRWEAQQDQR